MNKGGLSGRTVDRIVVWLELSDTHSWRRILHETICYVVIVIRMVDASNERQEWRRGGIDSECV